MMTVSGFFFPLVLGISIGTLFSYSVFIKRSTLYTIRGIVWPTALDGNESELTRVTGLLPEVATSVDQIFFKDNRFHEDNATVAETLYQTVRILCLLMTYPANHQKKAIHVKSTWGKRCNKLLFVTRTPDDNLTTLILNVTDGRRNLGDKTREAFDHAYEHYLADYDWFLKADDDTYVIMENLRYFLSAEDYNSPVFFGQIFARHMRQGYPSGGAGYVASREAVRRFGRRSKNASRCQFNSGSEDIDFGLCMESLGVKLKDSLDALGRTRFHCFSTKNHIDGNYAPWYLRSDKYKGKKMGMTAMSDYSISFHYVNPGDMYLMEFLIYHLNPYGIINGLQNLNVIQTNGTTQ